MARIEWRRFLRAAVPICDDLRGYNRSTLKMDLFAGLTVALVALPQSMANAMIAGVPARYGLYTVIVFPIVAAIFGSSRHLITGPTNPAAVVTFAILAPLAVAESNTFIRLAAMLGALAGGFQLLAAALRAGRLLKFVSDAVIIGFTAGAGIYIATSQLAPLLGLPQPPGTRFHQIIMHVLGHLGQVDGWVLAVGAAAITVMVVARLLSRRIPAALMALIVTSVAAMLLRKAGVAELTLVGEIPHSLPRPQLPIVPTEGLKQLLFGAIALGMVGTLEATAIAKAIAMRSRQVIRINQEIAGQGLAKLTGSLFACIPGSGSFTRSALNYQSGARTRMAAVFSGLLVAVTLLLFAPLAEHIPRAALSGIIIVVAFQMVDREKLRRLVRTSRSEALVLAGTAVVTLAVPLQYAIFVGVGLSLLVFLHRAGHARVFEMVRENDRFFREIPIDDATGSTRICVIELMGDLFFARSADIQRYLTKILNNQPRVVILRMRYVHYIDGTVIHVMEQFVHDFQQTGGTVIISELRRKVRNLMSSGGLLDAIGYQNIFCSDREPIDPSDEALRRAEAVAAESGDDRPLYRSAEAANRSRI